VTARSLTRDLVRGLGAAQIVGYCIGWIATIGLGLAGVEIFKTSWDELAVVRTQRLVVNALRPDANGVLRIEPTSELIDEQRRAPGLKFAILHSDAHTPVAGSSQELASALMGVIGLSPTHTHFILPGDASPTPLGYMQPLQTPFGRLHVVIYRQKFRPDDVFYALGADLEWMIAYVICAMVASIATGWFAIHRGLRPILAVAEQATRIDMDTLRQRLSSEGAPQEIAPLIDAMNKALERLDAGVARQRRFAANAAHELRTPVAILSARLDAPEEPSFKIDLKRDVRRMRHIVEQLLAVTRLASPTEHGVDHVDLVALVRAACADAALLAIRKGRSIEIEHDGATRMVRADAGAVESVLANLIDNALHAEPAGGAVVVSIDSEDGARVRVIDHGEGVSPGERDQVFEPFWRKSPGRPGLGLGLAISKELIEAQGGTIRVEETPGGGATLCFILPLTCA
jgi:signal transduction histidine kinase